jgi:hypothetical protein
VAGEGGQDYRLLYMCGIQRQLLQFCCINVA